MSAQSSRGGNGARRAVRAIVVPVAACGLALTLFTALGVVRDLGDGWYVLGFVALLAAATVSERFPVPVGGLSAGGISLAASFFVAAALLYDWQTATVIGFLARGIIEVLERRPLTRLAYNTAVYAISSAAAGALVHAAGHGSVPTLLLAVAGGAFGFYAVNVGLVALVISWSSGQNLFTVIAGAGKATAVSFGLMSSISLILTVLWQRSPALSLALVGPLIAVALYQRSTYATFEAMRLANTDPLTGLGNHRSFDERLAALVLEQRPFVLCLVDVDGFKQVNDRHGHQAGDTVLTRIAELLTPAGESFRLGGDELAVVTTSGSLDALEAVRQRIQEERFELDIPVTVSIGVAHYPDDAVDVDRIVASADTALYHAKRQGKNQVARFEQRAAELKPVVQLETSDRPRWLAELTGIVEAAGRLDASATPGHAQRVADLAARVALRLGIAKDEVEQIAVAAQLHDIGKLTLPVEVLTKRGSLADVEWRALREHPETARRILSSLGAGPIADWVLHQNERWDGTGYPSGLAGEAIPLASRIIFAVDAFDTMMSDRPYKKALSLGAACGELSSCAGTQFDPQVVRLLLDEVVEEELRRAV